MGITSRPAKLFLPVAACVSSLGKSKETTLVITGAKAGCCARCHTPLSNATTPEQTANQPHHVEHERVNMCTTLIKVSYSCCSTAQPMPFLCYLFGTTHMAGSLAPRQHAGTSRSCCCCSTTSNKRQAHEHPLEQRAPPQLRSHSFHA